MTYNVSSGTLNHTILYYTQTLQWWSETNRLHFSTKIGSEERIQKNQNDLFVSDGM